MFLLDLLNEFLYWSVMGDRLIGVHLHISILQYLRVSLQEYAYRPGESNEVGTEAVRVHILELHVLEDEAWVSQYLIYGRKS